MLQVADSAVKIGLGALITAVAGYLVLKQNQRGQVASEFREEKRRYIGNLLEAIGYASHRALDYWSYVNDRELNKALGLEIPEAVTKRLDESGRQFHASFEQITLMEGKYFVVAGEVKYRQLVEYPQFLSRFHWDSAFGSVTILQGWPSREKALRETLLASIRESYSADKHA